MHHASKFRPICLFKAKWLENLFLMENHEDFLENRICCITHDPIAQHSTMAISRKMLKKPTSRPKYIVANDCSIFSKAYICTMLSVIANESPSQAQSSKEDEEEDAPGVPWVEYVLFQLANKGPVNYWTTCAPYPGLLWFSVPAFSTLSEMSGCVASGTNFTQLTWHQVDAWFLGGGRGRFEQHHSPGLAKRSWATCDAWLRFCGPNPFVVNAPSPIWPSMSRKNHPYMVSLLLGLLG